MWVLMKVDVGERGSWAVVLGSSCQEGQGTSLQKYRP